MSSNLNVDQRLVFGPMLLGVCANLVLYGVLLIQVLTYYQAYQKDGRWMKLFILYLFVAETLNSAMDIAMVYQPLVSEHGTGSAVTYFPLTLAAGPILTVAISTPIQLFIAYRLRFLSLSYVLPLIISLLAVLSFVGGVYTSVKVSLLRLFSMKPSLHNPALVWLLSSAISDVLITIGLCYNLWRHKTGFLATDTVISRIIRLTIQTGFITTAFAILDVVCFLAFPSTTINFIWDFPLSKLYSNASVLLSTLNARAHWKRAMDNVDSHNVLFGEQPRSRRQSQNLTLTTPEFAIAKCETGRPVMAFATEDLDLETRCSPSAATHIKER